MVRPRRRDPGARRLSIIVVLIAAMVLTLLGRLTYVQLLDPGQPGRTAAAQWTGSIPLPATRGAIVDAMGRPLVDGTVTQVLTVDRQTVLAQPDRGRAVLARVAELIKTSPATLAHEITPCSPTVAAPCWTGEPYQAVPVLTDAPTAVVLAVDEHREDFPGVAVQTSTLDNYPGGSLAAHVLGYTGLVTAADVKADPALDDADSIGVSGLEQQYDAALRGTDGAQEVLLDPQGDVVGSGATRAAVPGDTLVTSIDANVQKLAESSLAQQIADSRKAGKPATSGAVVVMDPDTGRIIASASYPTYDPQQFVGGISTGDYAALTAPSANDPLLDRAIAGEYAPGSTFKLITTSSDVMHGELNTTDTFPCPPSLDINGQVKTNYDSESFDGPITLAQALGYSCDTFFYAPAVAEYDADQVRVDNGQKPEEYLQQMAAAYGIGTAPGVDLPADEQAAGSYSDREIALATWQANKATYCANAKAGYPDVANAADRAYYTALAKENCTDGWRYNAGENADLAIGQGATTLSPLQLAVAYSAMFNGGKIYEPTFGWAVVNPQGQVVQKITPKVRDTVPVSSSLFDYIANSLNFGKGWAVSGAFAYIGSPYQSLIGGKTGTAEVFGKQDTSWLASWGPVSTDSKGNVHAKFVVVGMVEQAGTGATAAGPMLKRIWDGIMGVGQKPVIAGSQPETHLPVVTTTAAVDAKPTTAVRAGPQR